ncbi:MAG: hypothetical protein LC775_03885 [Acidobacteria bacterium]|nr:hypothetical protein [Acidobacteriota bacterium]
MRSGRFFASLESACFDDMPDGLYDVLTTASYDALLADGRRVDGEDI